MAYTLDNTEMIIENIIGKLLGNDDLMKCLGYDHPNALNEDSLTDGEKMALVSNEEKYLRILRVPFSSETVESVRSEIRVFVNEIVPDNIHLADVEIAIEVVCSNHMRIQRLIDGKSRPNKMVNEILKCLNGQEIQGIGRLYFQRPIRMVRFNKSYSGYALLPNIRMG